MAKKTTKERAAAKVKEKQSKKDTKKPPKAKRSTGRPKPAAKRDIETAVAALLSDHAGSEPLTLKQIAAKLKRTLKEEIAADRVLTATASVLSRGKLSSRYSLAVIPTPSRQRPPKKPINQMPAVDVDLRSHQKRRVAASALEEQLSTAKLIRQIVCRSASPMSRDEIRDELRKLPGFGDILDFSIDNGLADLAELPDGDPDKIYPSDGKYRCKRA
jgi:hypothetical protein